ncbi:uncharacterized protein LOC132197699 [Neocloeon triangulifer]|uniref:uncharacterized protein LOC132197699 n=1 Tax=Neocloeon triangulifer TaxID=2078957 RepID=UPI00286F02BC|nr:uncharacterized protein LOC132197699 [Neocloeon triangulifer]
MHTVGLHSALAIKRQRKRREEQKRARERRFSSHSVDSHGHSALSPRNSIVSLDGAVRHRNRKHPTMLDTKVVTSVGMMHIGVVFLVFGGFLIVSALLPATDDDAGVNGKPISVWNELLFSGIFCLVVGIFLVVLNHFVSKQADDDLNTYVSNQLNRSKSGHRLVRDVETGHMSTPRRQPREDSSSSGSLHTSQEGKREDLDNNEPVPVHHSHHPHLHKTSPISSPPPCINGEPPLEKIIEEDCSEYSIASSRRARRFFSEEKQGEEESRTAIDVTTIEASNDNSTTGSVSPTTPSETQELLTSRSMKMYRM